MDECSIKGARVCVYARAVCVYLHIGKIRPPFGGVRSAFATWRKNMKKRKIKRAKI